MQEGEIAKARGASTSPPQPRRPARSSIDVDVEVCCNLISACEPKLGDVERATQWCDEVKEFAKRWSCGRSSTCVTNTQGCCCSKGRAAAADRPGHGRPAAHRRRNGPARRTAPAPAPPRRGPLAVRAVGCNPSRMGMVGSHSTRRHRDRARPGANGWRANSTSISVFSRVEVRVGVREGGGGRAPLPPGRTAAAELERSPRRSTATGRAQRRAGPPAFSTWPRGISRPRPSGSKTRSTSTPFVPAPYQRAHARLTFARALGEPGSTDRALNEADAAHAAFDELTATRDAAEAAGSPVAETRHRARRPAHTPARCRSSPWSRWPSNREIAAKLVVSGTHRAPTSRRPAEARRADASCRRRSRNARWARVAGSGPIGRSSAYVQKIAWPSEAPAGTLRQDTQATERNTTCLSSRSS